MHIKDYIDHNCYRSFGRGCGESVSSIQGNGYGGGNRTVFEGDCYPDGTPHSPECYFNGNGTSDSDRRITHVMVMWWDWAIYQMAHAWDNK